MAGLADVKYAYQGQHIVLWDLSISRSQQEHINYEVIESIKNGVYLSTKYESAMRVFPITSKYHMLLFSQIAHQTLVNCLTTDRMCEK